MEVGLRLRLVPPAVLVREELEDILLRVRVRARVRARVRVRVRGEGEG